MAINSCWPKLVASALHCLYLLSEELTALSVHSQCRDEKGEAKELKPILTTLASLVTQLDRKRVSTETWSD